MNPLPFIGGLRGALSGLAGAALMLFFMSLYDRLWDDPAVAKAARLEFVAIAEESARRAQALEAGRQKEAGEKARLAFEKDAAARQSLALQDAVERGQEIATYEIQIEKLGRACRLDGGDLDFLLRQPRNKAARSRR
jgi:hypothetical protein